MIAAAVAAIALTSAGTATVDRTVSCRIITSLDQGSIYIRVDPAINYLDTNHRKVTLPAEVQAGGQGEGVFAAASKQIEPGPGRAAVTAGYYFDNTVCKNAPAIPFTHAGLQSVAPTSTGNPWNGARCLVPPNVNVTVRLRVVVSKPGVPTSAQVAVQAGRKQHPIAYIAWTPTRVTAWASAGCETP